MTSFYAQYDSTGAKDGVDVKRSGRLSVCVTSQNGDATYTIQGKLKNEWRNVGMSAVVDGEISSSIGPLEEIRLNITSLGTGSTVDFEVLGD